MNKITIIEGERELVMAEDEERGIREIKMKGRAKDFKGGFLC